MGIAGHAGLFGTAKDVAVIGQMMLNGGTDNGKVQEAGDFMYGRSVSDPAGTVLEIMWMDVDAAMKAWGQAA